MQASRLPARIEVLESRISPATIIALAGGNSLFRFDSAAPASITSSISITGLQAGDVLIGIDFRPATGQLYVLSQDATLYTLNPVTAAAQFVVQLAPDPGDSSAPFSGLTGSSFGFDFNPAADLIRVTSDTGQNLRIHPATGLTITDTVLNPNSPEVGAVAYTNSFPGTTATTLYGIDAINNRLVIQNPPNAGALSPVGSGFGFDVGGVSGFDIGLSELAAFAVLRDEADSLWRLYLINLQTGTSTQVGLVASGGTPIRGITVLQNTWTGAGTDANTTNAANWAAGIVPGPGDSLIFPAFGATREVNFTHGSSVFFDQIAVTGTSYTLGSGGAIRATSGLNFTTPGTLEITGSLAFSPSSQPARLQTVDDGFVTIDALSTGLNNGLELSGAGVVTVKSATSSGSTFDVRISGPTVTIEGSGWSQPTVLQSGELRVDGSLGSITQSGGLLRGAGTIAALTATGGTLSAGRDSLAVTGDFSLDAGATLSLELTGGVEFSPLRVGGAVTLGGVISFNSAGSLPGKLTLIENGGGSVSGNFAGRSEGAAVTLSGVTFSISYAGNDGNDITLKRTSGLLAATIQPGGKTATFTDVDGDLVTVRITNGTLGAGNLLIRQTATGQGQLEVLDLTGSAAFENTNVTLTARRTALGGNGAVDLGRLDATGIDLGTVSIAGDLGVIDAGDATPRDSALKALTVNSLGARGLATGAADLRSDLDGRVDKLTVRGDVSGVVFTVGDRLADAPNGNGNGNATIGALVVGGALRGGTADDSGRIQANDAILSARITGGIFGGDGRRSGTLVAADRFGAVASGPLAGGLGESSGQISTGGAYATLTITGSLTGGAGLSSGRVEASTGGAVTVLGSVVGGAGGSSGTVELFNAASVRVARDLRGGSGEDSGVVRVADRTRMLTVGGNVFGGDGPRSGLVATTFGTIDALTITGSVVGGAGVNSASLQGGNVNRITIGGSLLGGTGADSAQLAPAASLSVSIGGSVRGGAPGSASIIPGTAYTVAIGDSVIGGAIGSGFVGGAFTSASIGGDLVGGSGASSGVLDSSEPVRRISILGSVFAGAGPGSGGIQSTQALGDVSIGGSIFGTSANPVIIAASGGFSASGAVDPAVKSLTVRGSVRFAQILAGYASGSAANADAQIGAVNVGGDWIASSIVAGVEDADLDGFGDADDVKISSGSNTSAVDSRIASIVIKGQALGTSAPGDHFGIVAQEIVSLSINGVKIELSPSKQNDDLTATNPALLLGPTGDFRVREVPL